MSGQDPSCSPPQWSHIQGDAYQTQLGRAVLPLIPTPFLIPAYHTAPYWAAEVQRRSRAT
ncbi:hypothetical protein LEMLEM_LOCUS23729, partial [Lemmus lemmus]